MERCVSNAGPWNVVYRTLYRIGPGRARMALSGPFPTGPREEALGRDSGAELGHRPPVSAGAEAAAQGPAMATLKLLVLGDSAVGKSSLLLRFTDDTFEPHLNPTIEFTALYPEYHTVSHCFSGQLGDYTRHG
ncbi:sperm axonemal maintenance protein CFAP97D1 isoform X3 [Mauremys mutica]|uniref:sperm axonemal maintenance protein CFAP97D1 isoform X3 n=1 Tax=Mauremys mutica TaxID=74926 RepID=UPI001D168717|nr:sperm axonemal maintenance protein CFAP97D1 isoform X3 [Mauremys mutica]